MIYAPDNNNNSRLTVAIFRHNRSYPVPECLLSGFHWS